MRIFIACLVLGLLSGAQLDGDGATGANDPERALERTCFQTGQAHSGAGHLPADVAIVYGIDPGLPKRIESWREKGFRIHVMTGVSWGHYQDYLYGRFDGINHEDEAQTDSHGNKISHGGDVYYMCPGTNFGKFLCVGVQRALDAGAEAIHLEEPEFWVRGGYSQGFKREWRNYYHEDWQPPHQSVDAQWRSSKLKYFLYRRALQQVFDHVQEYNRRNGRQVQCYVPTHSLLNYAHWRIVSPESSLAQLNGCNGYIAQVWTGTARTPNMYHGRLRERTFETAFLEYGAMQNLVRATGRTVWYLNDPVEDNPGHDWRDYQQNWESTLVASLLQPEVWQYEVAPWPERVFAGRYPRRGQNRESIPPEYATELQVVMNALNDMNQRDVAWEGNKPQWGVLISDTLMFQRGEPGASDPHLGHFYGLALPLLERGHPVVPVQLETMGSFSNLNELKVLLLSYAGQKPSSPEAHDSVLHWVKGGGALLVVDNDADPYHRVREWWNTNGFKFATPREHLFAGLGISADQASSLGGTNSVRVGKGSVFWLREHPANLAGMADGDDRLMQVAGVAAAQAGVTVRDLNHLQLQRGPFVVAAGLSESPVEGIRKITGRFVNLFDSELKVLREISITPGARLFLRNLEHKQSLASPIIASAGRVSTLAATAHALRFKVEGVPGTQAVTLLRCLQPISVTLDTVPMTNWVHDAAQQLTWLRYTNETTPRTVSVTF